MNNILFHTFNILGINILAYVLFSDIDGIILAIVLVGGIANIMSHFFNKIEKNIKLVFETLISTIFGLAIFYILMNTEISSENHTKFFW